MPQPKILSPSSSKAYECLDEEETSAMFANIRLPSRAKSGTRTGDGPRKDATKPKICEYEIISDLTRTVSGKGKASKEPPPNDYEEISTSKPIARKSRYSEEYLEVNDITIYDHENEPNLYDARF